MRARHRVPALPLLALTSILALILAAAQPADAEPQVSVLKLPFKVAALRGPGSVTVQILPTANAPAGSGERSGERAVVWGPGGGAVIRLSGDGVETTLLRQPAGETPLPEAPRDAIPSSQSAHAGPLTAYLAQPRSDYRHGVLGDAVEAGRVTIDERQPLGAPTGEARPVPKRRSVVETGAGAVFEDLVPRLADLDRDGVPEILVVKSYLDRGSALAVIGWRDGRWGIVAETPPIGQPNRWLNPAATADFDGDGIVEIALVRTPHLAGVLQVWNWQGGRLVLKHERPGYSNHAIGSTALENAAAIDLDGDGRPELAIPTLDRAALAILSLARGIEEVRRIPLPARAERGLTVLGAGRNARIVVAMEDGRVALIRP